MFFFFYINADFNWSSAPNEAAVWHPKPAGVRLMIWIESIIGKVLITAWAAASVTVGDLEKIMNVSHF